MYADVIECRHWQPLGEGHVQCRVCPHKCRIPDGGRGICFVRRNVGGRLCLAFGHRVSSLALDPVEKKPLYHYLPGTATLSIGGTGCNLSCRFCQNAPISKPGRDPDLQEPLSAESLVRLAQKHRAPSVSFTYNEPIVALEYVVECARACRAAGLRTIAVTNGYICGEARDEFFDSVDAANVDLKAFTDDFYRQLCGARLAPVLDTLQYIRKRTRTWLEVTTLLIPGENDAPTEIEEMTRWAVGALGPDTPWHFSAFYPMYRMTDRPPTPPETLYRARDIAHRNGLRYVYVGNISDGEGHSTFCRSCGALLLERGRMSLRSCRLRRDGTCPSCGTRCPGVFTLAGSPLG